MKPNISDLRNTFEAIRSEEIGEFSQQKSNLMEKFEENLKKTLESINSYKVNPLNEEIDQSEESDKKVNIGDFLGPGRKNQQNKNQKIQGWNLADESDDENDAEIDEDDDDDDDDEEIDLERLKQLARAKFGSGFAGENTEEEEEQRQSIIGEEKKDLTSLKSTDIKPIDNSLFSNQYLQTSTKNENIWRNENESNQQDKQQDLVYEKRISKLQRDNDELNSTISAMKSTHSQQQQIMKEQLQSSLERHQNSMEIMKKQYESEINRLYEEIDILKSNASPNVKKKQSIETQTGSPTNTSDNLERNFLKLKELYDTLYKANLALMKDQKDLESKYSKLLKAYNKQQTTINPNRKPKISRDPQTNTNTVLKRRSASRNSSGKQSNSASKRKAAGLKKTPMPIHIDDSVASSYLSYNLNEQKNNSKMLDCSNASSLRNDESILFSNSLIQKSVKMNKKKKPLIERSNSRKRSSRKASRSLDKDGYVVSSTQKAKDSNKSSSKKAIPKARTCMLSNNPNYY